MFVFFWHKTAYEMCISDWSSDVCSSDLDAPAHPLEARDAILPRCVRIALVARQCVTRHRQHEAGIDAVIAGGNAEAAAGADGRPTFGIGGTLARPTGIEHPAADRLRIGALKPGRRSRERRGGKECDSTCRTRWGPYSDKKTTGDRDTDGTV